MQWRADLLAAERFEDLAREYLLPLALYQDDNQVVLHWHDEVAKLFALLHTYNLSRGVARMVARVTAVDLPRHGRFRVWMRYHELDALGCVVSLCDVVQYCRETPEGLKAEMAEYGLCPLPDIWAGTATASVH